jgi:hypothetical protein
MPRLRISVVITLCAVLGCAVVSQAAVSDTRPFRLIHRGGITLPSTARDRNGNDVEIMTMPALETAWREARRDFEREHTTPFLWDQPERFRLANVQ